MAIQPVIRQYLYALPAAAQPQELRLAANTEKPAPVTSPPVFQYPSTYPSLLNRLADKAIVAYQRITRENAYFKKYYKPLCSYFEDGFESCSAYGRNQYATQPFMKATLRTISRVLTCSPAYDELKHTSPDYTIWAGSPRPNKTDAPIKASVFA